MSSEGVPGPTLEAYKLVVRCGSRGQMEAFLPLAQHRAYLARPSVQMMQFSLRVISPDESVLWQEMPCLLWVSTNGNMLYAKRKKNAFPDSYFKYINKIKVQLHPVEFDGIHCIAALTLHPQSQRQHKLFFFFFTDPCLLVNELTELSGYRERDKVSLFAANTAH